MSYSALESNTIDNYAALESQQSNLLYHFSGGASNGYVFELVDMDTSGAIDLDPSFAEILQNLTGLPDVDATVEIDASLSLFNGLFSIQVDSSDVNDVSSADVLFRVNDVQDDTYNDISDTFNVGSFFNDISYSETVVKSGNINTYYSLQNLKYDFVRHLAKSITGGYSSSDIFTNESNLITAVSNLDTTLNTQINTIVSGAAAIGFKDRTYTSGSYSSLIAAAIQLYNLNLQSDDGGDVGVSRSDQLLADLAQASTNVSVDVSNNGGTDNSTRPLNVPLRFAAGDRLAVRITYHPQNAVFSANGANIPSRSYKVLLHLVE